MQTPIHEDCRCRPICLQPSVLKHQLREREVQEASPGIPLARYLQPFHLMAKMVGFPRCLGMHGLLTSGGLKLHRTSDLVATLGPRRCPPHPNQDPPRLLGLLPVLRAPDAFRASPGGGKQTSGNGLSGRRATGPRTCSLAKR